MLTCIKIGQAEPVVHTIKLFKLVSKIINKLPNKVSITGHTDAKPYRNRKDYSNWELSSDHSNAARRYLLKFGINHFLSTPLTTPKKTNAQ